MSFKYRVISLFFLACSNVSFAFAGNYQDLINGADTVDEAVASIIDVVEKQGYEVVLIIDHAAAAESIGLNLRPTQVVLARPPTSLERGLLFRSATIGIDLPQKFLVFEDENGTIQLRYDPVGYLVDRHDVLITDLLLSRLRKSTEQFGDLEDGLVTVASQQDFATTVDALFSVISANPAFRIPLVLQYGLVLEYGESGPVLIVFGNPNAGTPLMQSTQKVGLDLPQKFLVWKNRRGEVLITYNDPFFLAKRHNVQGQDERLSAIGSTLASFASAGAGLEN
ncbi:MAG: DUF302 domain-containing protein [Gammaproteobacteria bacterium]